MYSTLSRMARDYLAIQGSSTPSEWAFSSGGMTDHSWRNQLTPQVFEALQLLKSAYHNKHMQAETDAEVHVEVDASVENGNLYLSDT
jgi:hypothetical protein